MKTKYLIISIATLFGLAFAGCNKQLNVSPTTQEVDGKVIVDAKSAQTTLNGVYYRFADGGVDYNSNPSILWCSVNETLPSELSGMLTYPYGGTVFASHTYNPTSGVDGMWNYGYDIVNAANGFIKNIAPVTTIAEDMKNEMIADAKFLRAFANSQLLFYYGQYQEINSPYGIILRNDFVTSNDINLPRASVKETYDSIISDLDDAINYLPNLNTRIYYANKWAAELLKAQVLINRAQSGDNAEVISLCNDIITNGPFSLDANEKNIFLNEGLSSNEVILGIQPYPNDTYKYNWYLYYNQDIGSDSLVSWFQNDPRNQWVYQMEFNGYTGGNIPLITKYYPGNAANPSPAAISNVGYAFRLTEAYLLEAEALVESGGSMDEAKTLLKTVLQHAGFTDFSDVGAANTANDLQLLIIKEEMKNFVAENGADWMAVRRLPFSELQALIPTIQNQSQLILPIPQDEITRNNQIKQNPGY